VTATDTVNAAITGSNISDVNPGATVTQMAFYYYDSSGTTQILGYGTEISRGAWTLTFTINLASGTYTMYAQAEDSYGVGDYPMPISLQFFGDRRPRSIAVATVVPPRHSGVGFCNDF
jgi:hypothetical protein